VASDDDDIDDSPFGGYDERPTNGYDDAWTSESDEEGPTSICDDVPPPPTVNSSDKVSRDGVCIVCVCQLVCVGDVWGSLALKYWPEYHSNFVIAGYTRAYSMLSYNVHL